MGFQKEKEIKGIKQVIKKAKAEAKPKVAEVAKKAFSVMVGDKSLGEFDDYLAALAMANKSPGKLVENK